MWIQKLCMVRRRQVTAECSDIVLGIEVVVVMERGMEVKADGGMRMEVMSVVVRGMKVNAYVERGMEVKADVGMGMEVMSVVVRG